MKRVHFAILTAVLLLCSFQAMAMPILIEYDKIEIQTLENFDHFTPFASIPTPALFNGFSYDASSAIAVGFFCGSTEADEVCLSDSSFTSPRAFYDFEAGTTQFGLRIVPISNDDLIVATIEGTSGTLVLPISGAVELGFQDATGLSNVSFTNLARPLLSIANYSFDNVITGSGSSGTLPAPSSLLLTIISLSLVGRFRLTD